MAYATIDYRTEGRIAHLAFNRPDNMNAFSKQLCADVTAAVREADDDPEVRVLVIRGAGQKAFSAGYDIAESAAGPKRGLSEWRAKLAQDLAFTCTPWHCSKPVIAMIHGHCLGGGLEFAQMCDMRFAAQDAKFGVVETRFAAGIATYIMPWIIGPDCRRLIYTGDVIGADEALRIRLVDGVFPSETLEEETMKVAGRIAQVALDALQWNKRVINRTFDIMGLTSSLQYGLEACAILDSTETPEGKTFDDLRRTQGLREALRWRRDLFAPYE